jgi:uncharacterized membrane protein YkvA (DUF1232 family)
VQLSRSAEEGGCFFIWHSLRLLVIVKEQDEKRQPSAGALRKKKGGNDMWGRLISFRNWGHVFRRVIPLLLSNKIPLKEKLLFAIPALVYCISPDLLPFLPVDDIVVTLFLMNFFTNRVEKKYKLQ